MRAPRPVAGLPAVDPAELAKAWLLELIAAAPLEQAAHVRVPEFTREAPVLCAAALAALAADDALVALERPGARAGALAGARDAQGVIAATEALRSAASRLLRVAIQDAAVALDATDRLAHITARIAQASLASRSRAGAPADALAEALDRHARTGEPFVLLAGEVVDRERWRASDPQAIETATAAVSASLRPADRLVCDEQPGRWWLVAPDTDAPTARELAAALAEAAEHAGPAAVAFGLAACPHDGVDAEALRAHADEALFSARAAGLPV